MERSILGRALAACAAVAMLSTGTANAAERIVFVGDSITGQSRNHGEGFANQLDAAYAATMAEGDRPSVISLGGSGQTVESWLNVEKQSRDNPSTTLDVAGVYVGQNLDQHADRLVVMLGMNNALSPSTSEDPASLAAYKGNYYGLVTNLVRRATPADLYLASVPPCTEDPSGPKNRLVQKMNENIRELVAELPTDAACLALQPGLQVHYVPVWENQTNLLAVGRALTPAFHVTGDMVHPSGEGHIRIAQSFLDAFGHDAASAWLVANRLQAKFDAAANGNTAGISHVLRPTGAGSVAGQHAFSLKAYWVVRPGETAPDSVAFALKLPKGWNETAPVAVDGLQATFTFQGPADRAPSSIGITATPSTGNQRSLSVGIPAPWRVSTPFQLAWSNASGNWVFPSATADGATEAAIEAGSDFATIETADTARTPSWVDYFPSVDYVGGDNSASLDLSAVAAYEIFGTAYALRYIYAEKATTAKISLSTAAFAITLHTTVWVNGEKVLDADSTGTKADITLNAGNNVIAVRTSHLTWQWQVGVAVEADDNSFDLRYGLAPLEAEEEDDTDYEPEVTATLFDGSIVYTFLSNGFFRAECPGTADVFIVGGGGGGAGNPLETLTGGGMQVGAGYDVRAGGGGGGGGVVYKTGVAIAANTDYAITVGAGGTQNRNGKSSFAFGYEALGGGHGGRNGLDPASGASGGGAGSLSGNAEWTEGASAADAAGGSQGNAGGRGYSAAYNAPGFGGGGGGAGGAGGDATTGAVGAGGAGVPCPFLENSSGYGAGGAGGFGSYGNQDPTMNCGANGADGFGQGGVGGGSYVHVSAGWGGTGGSGTVIIRFYPDELDPNDYPNTPSVHALKDGTLVYTYSTPGSALFTPPSDTTVKVFLVGGGGGGGGCNIAKELLPTDTGVYVADGYSTRGGGGGAGGAVVSNDNVSVEKRAYVITVGAGGAQNSNGGSSYAFGLQAAGGGAGAWNGAAATAGGNGGGGNYNHPAGAYAEGFNAGGNGIDAGGNVGRGGGGAGAGGAGVDATAGVSGAGGPGVVCPYIADSPIYGAGGNGGQVFGTSSPYNNSAADAAPGTGNGGDGCNTWYHINAGAGGAGGCGCVIIVCPPTSGYFREEAIHEATGGEKLLVKDDGKWMTHSFLEDGTFSVDEPLCVQALLVGGGGAGGKANNVRGGGGGAGGVLLLDKVFLLPGDYPVVVGAGGETAGADGEPSTFDDYVALGGGGGGNAWNSAGRTGGSGGGGCGPFQVTDDTVAGGSAAATDPMQGHDGGYGIWNHADTNGKAGGGGGAGGNGEDATLGKSGSGGDAVECAFLGAGHYYAAGGGAGGSWSTDCGVGGMGGETELGGHGGYYAGTDGEGKAILVSGTDGANGTGSGGGGEGSVANQNSGFGKGGSGIVIIRYRLAPNGTLLMLR